MTIYPMNIYNGKNGNGKPRLKIKALQKTATAVERALEAAELYDAG
jgi:hypothetical protein